MLSKCLHSYDFRISPASKVTNVKACTYVSVKCVFCDDVYWKFNMHQHLQALHFGWEGTVSQGQELELFKQIINIWGLITVCTMLLLLLTCATQTHCPIHFPYNLFNYQQPQIIIYLICTIQIFFQTVHTTNVTSLSWTCNKIPFMNWIQVLYNTYVPFKMTSKQDNSCMYRAWCLQWRCFVFWWEGPLPLICCLPEIIGCALSWRALRATICGSDTSWFLGCTLTLLFYMCPQLWRYLCLGYELDPVSSDRSTTSIIFF